MYSPILCHVCTKSTNIVLRQAKALIALVCRLMRFLMVHKLKTQIHLYTFHSNILECNTCSFFTMDKWVDSFVDKIFFWKWSIFHMLISGFVLGNFVDPIEVTVVYLHWGCFQNTLCKVDFRNKLRVSSTDAFKRSMVGFAHCILQKGVVKAWIIFTVCVLFSYLSTWHQ